MYTYDIHICICYLLLSIVSIDMSGILSRKAPVGECPRDPQPPEHY